MSLIRRAPARRRTRTVSAFTVPVTSSTPAVASIAFPADAKNTNVTSYGADPTGVADSTAAILQACLDHDRDDVTVSPSPPVSLLSPQTIFLPAGTYRLTDSINITGSNIRLIGAGEGATILKLDNNAVGYGSAGTPKYVVKTGSATAGRDANAAFSNYVQHLTIDVGTGNPGAVALRYDAANVGAVERVTLKAGTGSGLYGLTFETSPGAAYVRDLTVTGFDHSIYYNDSANISNNIVFYNAVLRNPRVSAVHNSQGNLHFEGLTVVGAPIAISSATASPSIIVVGGSLTAPGSGVTGPAISTATGGYVFLRDVTATGFGAVVKVGATSYFTGGTVAEWSSWPYQVGNTVTAWTESTGYKSLRLPIKPTPTWFPTDVSNWVSVGNYATPQAAVDAAMAAGKEVVYFPYDFYTLTADLVIGGSIRKVDFMGSAIQKASAQKIIVDSSSTVATVWLENITSRCEIQQNSAATMVVRNWANQSGSPVLTTGASATGDVFLENAGPHHSINITKPVNVWVRQLNRERAGGITASAGAKVWEFGDNIEEGKTDPQATPIVISGSTTRFEQIGGIYDYYAADSWPLSGAAVYQITDAHVSVVMPVTVGQVGTVTYVAHWLSDIRAGSPVGNVNSSSADLVGPVYASVRQRAIPLPLYVSPP